MRVEMRFSRDVLVVMFTKLCTGPFLEEFLVFHVTPTHFSTGFTRLDLMSFLDNQTKNISDKSATKQGFLNIFQNIEKQKHF